MQVNARTLNTPFEILIQGPSDNRFVRNAKEFEQKRELVARSTGDTKSARNRRSTITIYKPSRSGAKRPALSLNAVETPSTKEDKLNLARHKRSVEHLEWFNDFASSLVRPSPLGSRAQKQRDAKEVSLKRQAAAAEPLSMVHREPWFMEQKAPLLNRPAPLYKRHHQTGDSQSIRKSKKNFSTNIRPDSIEESETEAPKPKAEIRPFRDALQVVERIPRVLQDTVSHLAADDNSGDVFSLNIMNDVLPKKISRKDQMKGYRRFRHNTRDRNVEPKPTAATRAPVVVPSAPLASLAPLAPLAPRGLLLPWLRQRRMRRFRGEQ